MWKSASRLQEAKKRMEYGLRRMTLIPLHSLTGFHCFSLLPYILSGATNKLNKILEETSCAQADTLELGLEKFPGYPFHIGQEASYL